MMSYIQENKEAWEEAFEHRRPGWGERNHEKLADNELPFFILMWQKNFN